MEQSFKRTREPFIPLTILEAKNLMDKAGITDIKGQAQFLECHITYWYTQLQMPEKLLSDKFCLNLIVKLNAKWGFIDIKPKDIVLRWIIERYQLNKKESLILSKMDLSKENSLRAIYARYQSVLTIERFDEMLTKGQLDVIRELSNLTVNDLYQIYTNGTKKSSNKHKSLKLQFYGAKNKRMDPDKCIRLWFGILIYYKKMDIKAITQKLKKIAVNGNED